MPRPRRVQVVGEREPSPDPFLQLVGRHSGLVTSALVFMFLIVKVVRVAKGNLITAQELVNIVGPASVIVGALTAVLPVLLAQAFVFLWVLSWTDGLDRRMRAGLIEVAFLLSLIGLYVLPWILEVGLLFFTLGHALYRIKVRPRLSRQPPNGLRATWLPAVVLLFLVSADPWIPAVTVDVGHPPSVLVAYVLKNDGGWTTLLRESDRSILILPSAEVGRRYVCRKTDGNLGRVESVVQLVLREGGSATTLPCPLELP